MDEYVTGSINVCIDDIMSMFKTYVADQMLGERQEGRIRMICTNEF